MSPPCILLRPSLQRRRLWWLGWSQCRKEAMRRSVWLGSSRYWTWAGAYQFLSPLPLALLCRLPTRCNCVCAFIQNWTTQLRIQTKSSFLFFSFLFSYSEQEIKEACKVTIEFIAPSTVLSRVIHLTKVFWQYWFFFTTHTNQNVIWPWWGSFIPHKQ